MKGLIKTSAILTTLLLLGCQSVPTTPQTPIDDSNMRTSLLQTDIAIEYFKEGNLHDCMVAVQEALAKNPKNAMAWMMLGMTYQTDGNADNLPKAKSAFEKAVKLAPDNPQIHNNYGQFLLKNRQISQAITEFKAAANVISYDSRESAYSNLGFAYLELAKLGNKNAKVLAAEAFNKSLSLSNNYEPALLGLKQLQTLR